MVLWYLSLLLLLLLLLLFLQLVLLESYPVSRNRRCGRWTVVGLLSLCSTSNKIKSNNGVTHVVKEASFTSSVGTGFKSTHTADASATGDQQQFAFKINFQHECLCQSLLLWDLSKTMHTRETKPSTKTNKTVKHVLDPSSTKQINAKCQTPNAKRQTPNAKWPSAKCQIAERQMPNGQTPNAK